MGKAARWFKGLFGIKKQNLNSSSGDEKGRERGGFGHSGRERVAGALCHNPETIPPNLSPAEATWLRSFYKETEEEQSKHAIAVAAATAAAADAAVAAAQAAVAVVRLTSHGRGGGGQRFAAVRIQTVFRGFLARKALRALKGLVKIQALVRGFLVRKQATATLHSMQAMIRAQATVRSQKFRRQMSNDNKNRAQDRARKSLERFDDTRSEHLSSVHSRRLSASLDAAALAAVDESPKIVEVDTGRPKSRSRRTNASISDFGDDPMSQSSPAPSCRHAGRLSIPDCRSYPETEWFLAGPDECRYSTTAQSTPRFNTNNCAPHAPPTPARSVSGDSFFRNYPNYMANTKSFRAKLRSYSAPKQRPEPATTKKRMSLSEVMEARSSLSGVKMQRSCSRVQEAINFKNAIMSKLDRSTDFSRERETETERYSVSGNVRT